MELKERLLGKDAAKAVEETAKEDLEREVPGIVEMLGDEGKKVNAAYAMSLISQKIPDSEAIKGSVPDLLELLNDKKTSLHGAIALSQVLQVDPENKEISEGIPAHAPLFLAMMLDVNDFILQNGALLLGHVASKDPDKVLELLSFLIEMLGYDRWRSRWNAIGILGLILVKHPQNKDIIGAAPTFVELMQDEAWQVRLNAVGISGSILSRNPGLESSNSILGGLIVALRDENENVRVMASNWLSALVSKNPGNYKGLIPVFEEALKDESGQVRDNAEKALKALKG